MSPVVPDETQRLLLRAACGGDGVAQPAWERWRATEDLDRVDRASFRLLPQLCRNLLAHGVDDPWLERLKGVYRFALSANAGVLGPARGVLHRLSAAGVPALLFDGAALVPLYHRDPGARLVDSLTLLVAGEHVAAAAHELSQLGWRPPDPLPRDGLPAHSSHSRFTSPGRPVEVWWDLLPLGTAAGVRAAVLAGAETVEIWGATALTLAPADHLLQICVRAARWEDPAPWWRLADAMVLLRAAEGRLDWDRLVEHARMARVVRPVRSSLRLLAEVLDAAVPATILGQLGRMPPSRMERLEQHMQERPPGRLGILPALLFRYWRLSSDGGRPADAADFAGYLQRAWGLRRKRDIPVAVVRKGIRRALTRG